MNTSALAPSDGTLFVCREGPRERATVAHLDKADLLAMDGPCSGGVAIDERPVDVLELSLGDACLTVPWDTRRL